MNIFICKYSSAIINLSYYTVQWLSNYDIAIISSYVWSFIIDFYAAISNWRITWLYESNNLFTHLHVQCTGLYESNILLSHLHVCWTINRSIAVTTCPITLFNNGIVIISSHVWSSIKVVYSLYIRLLHLSHNLKPLNVLFASHLICMCESLKYSYVTNWRVVYIWGISLLWMIIHRRKWWRCNFPIIELCNGTSGYCNGSINGSVYMSMREQNVWLIQPCTVYM